MSLPDTSNGSAYPYAAGNDPCGVAVNTHNTTPSPRHCGLGRCRALPAAIVAVYGGLDAACRKLCRASVPAPPAGRVPCWSSRTRWLVEVQAAYLLRYESTRPELKKRTGSGLSLRALLDVAGAMSAAADHRTGRSSRLAVDTITEHTGTHERLVQRSRTLLGLLGLGTEVQRGRHRSLSELRQRPRWDRSRGWASVWHLHPSRTAVIERVNRKVTPPRSGSFKEPRSSKKNSLAARIFPPVEKPARKPGVGVEQLQGVTLAARWQRHPDAPRWVGAVPVRDLGRALAPFAAHGWTPGDLCAAVNRHGPVIGRAIAPDRPLSWLRWLSEQVELSRPTTADIAAAAQRQAEEAARRRAEHEKGRRAGLAALSGPGRAAALAAVGLRPRRHGAPVGASSGLRP
jgi:hypothetical protein